MKHIPSPCLLRVIGAASLLALATLSAPAEVQSPENLAPYHAVQIFNSNGSVNTTWNGGLSSNLAQLFDTNLTNGVRAPGVHAGDYIPLEYDTLHYIARIKISRLLGFSYTIYTTENGTVWTPVTRLLSTETVDEVDGNPVMTDTWGIWLNATTVKFVFDEAGSSLPGLSEIEVLGYEVVTATSEIVSSYAKSTWHNADGSQMDSNGGGGGYSPASFFNGNFTDYCLLPRCPDNGYTIIDVTMNGSACYLEKILIGHAGNRKYSLYYSLDGSSWTAVAEQVQYAGIANYPVGALATKVKYVFNQGTAGNWTLKHLAEIQVWGIDPLLLSCQHPDLESAAWTVVPGSATCTERGTVERFCPDCEARFEAMGDLITAPPLGHDFVTHLDREGRYKQPGFGSLECSRCGYTIEFPEPIDLITSRVDNVKIGGMAMPGLVQFTDVSVSSENHADWGGGGPSMIDNDWTWVNAHLGVWASMGGMDNQYADFVFATEIDLTDVDFSVRNVDHLLLFYSVDDTTGEETLIGEYPVVRDEELVEVRDGTDVVCEWQRQSIHFYETPVKHLRIRRTDEASAFSLWGSSPCFVIVECHPWGTVKGAGELRYRRETVLIFH